MLIGLLLAQPVANSYAQSAWTLEELASATGTDAWHAAGHMGEGVRVGVFDVGFYGIETITDQFHLADSRLYASDSESAHTHGTQIVEIIQALAPRAEYYLFALNAKGDNVWIAVDWILAQDVHVVVMADSWLEIPVDGQNPIAQQMDRLAEAGIVVVVPAGNHGRSYLTATFRDTNRDGWHEFDGGYTAWGAIALQTTRFGQAHLRWLEPRVDLDLYVSAADGRRVLDASTLIQSDDNAYGYEDALFQTVAGQPFFVAVRAKTPGQSVTATFHLYVDGAVLADEPVPGSITVPGDSRHALTVGGLEMDNTIYDRSGRGPTWDGRIKPDLVAPVRVGVFFGTSVSTAIVGGIAAVLCEILDGPEAIKSYLVEHAIDLGPPGPDNDSGYGAVYLAPPQS